MYARLWNVIAVLCSMCYYMLWIYRFHYTCYMIVIFIMWWCFLLCDGASLLYVCAFYYYLMVLAYFKMLFFIMWLYFLLRNGTFFITVTFGLLTPRSIGFLFFPIPFICISFDLRRQWILELLSRNDIWNDGRMEGRNNGVSLALLKQHLYRWKG